MTVHYSFGKGRQLEIDVNGIVTKIDSLGEDDKHNQVTIPVDLKAGYNHIRMGNSYNWAPDIDCLRLPKECNRLKTAKRDNKKEELRSLSTPPVTTNN